MALQFLVIGGQRCGSTWLHSKLNQHPSIWMPPRIGELQYWDTVFGEEEYKPELFKHQMALINYLSIFDDRLHTCGEVTPSYSVLHASKIEALHRTCRDLKIILLIRNPIDWAWSTAKLHFKTPEDFNGAPISDIEKLFLEPGYFRKAEFDEIHRAWSSVFSSAQTLVLNFDDIPKNPTRILKACFEHLGVSSVFFPWSGVELKEKVNQISGRKMPFETRSFLVNMNVERIDRIVGYFGNSYSYWKEPVGVC